MDIREEQELANSLDNFATNKLLMRLFHTTLVIVKLTPCPVIPRA